MRSLILQVMTEGRVVKETSQLTISARSKNYWAKETTEWVRHVFHTQPTWAQSLAPIYGVDTTRSDPRVQHQYPEYHWVWPKNQKEGGKERKREGGKESKHGLSWWLPNSAARINRASKNVWFTFVFDTHYDLQGLLPTLHSRSHSWQCSGKTYGMPRIDPRSVHLSQVPYRLYCFSSHYI